MLSYFLNLKKGKVFLEFKTMTIFKQSFKIPVLQILYFTTKGITSKRTTFDRTTNKTMSKNVNVSQLTNSQTVSCLNHVCYLHINPHHGLHQHQPPTTINYTEVLDLLSPALNLNLTSPYDKTSIGVMVLVILKTWFERFMKPEDLNQKIQTLLWLVKLSNNKQKQMKVLVWTLNNKYRNTRVFHMKKIKYSQVK